MRCLTRLGVGGGLGSGPLGSGALSLGGVGGWVGSVSGALLESSIYVIPILFLSWGVGNHGREHRERDECHR